MEDFILSGLSNIGYLGMSFLLILVKQHRGFQTFSLNKYLPEDVINRNLGNDMTGNLTTV